MDSKARQIASGAQFGMILKGILIVVECSTHVFSVSIADNAKILIFGLVEKKLLKDLKPLEFPSKLKITKIFCGRAHALIMTGFYFFFL
jgi:hypothetical protein